jgi:hypothetical protein
MFPFENTSRWEEGILPIEAPLTTPYNWPKSLVYPHERRAVKMAEKKEEILQDGPIYCGNDGPQDAPKPDAALIKEAVRRTVEQYGEVLRRLADE